VKERSEKLLWLEIEDRSRRGKTLIGVTKRVLALGGWGLPEHLRPWW